MDNYVIIAMTAVICIIISMIICVSYLIYKICKEEQIDLEK